MASVAMIHHHAAGEHDKAIAASRFIRCSAPLLTLPVVHPCAVAEGPDALM